MNEAEMFNRYVKKRIGTDWFSDPRQRDRFMILKRFLFPVKGYVLDVGCGEIQPIIICNHPNLVATDIAISALTNLKKKRFKGHLVLVSCLNLPFKNKCFKKAICSEVIEHLPTDFDVKKCIEELKRVSDIFMLTTPNNKFDFRWLHETHRRFLNEKSIWKFLPEKSAVTTSNVPQTAVPIPVLPYFLLDKPQTFIGRCLRWLDRKLRETPIGVLTRKFKSKLLGGAFVVAICHS